MAIEDARAELQQHRGVMLPKWLSTAGSSPATVINSTAHEASLAHRIVNEYEVRVFGRIPLRAVEKHRGSASRSDLDEALSDLAQAGDEAREDGFEPPPELAILNADRVLRDMYAHRPCRFDVYPTPDREVAIYAPEDERSVLVLCGPDGSVRCSVNLNGKHCRAYYDPAFAGDLPAGFLRDALAALDAA